MTTLLYLINFLNYVTTLKEIRHIPSYCPIVSQYEVASDKE